MITKSDLKKNLRKNNIEFFSSTDKQKLANLAKEHGVFPEEAPKPEKTRDPRFDRLKDIRKDPRTVLVQDVKTGEIHTFPSIYQASKFIQCNPRTVVIGMVESGKIDIE